MSKITIIPPGQNLPVPTQSGNTLAPYNPGGAVSSTLARWQIERETRVYNALTARTNAVTSLYNAQTSAMEAYARRERAAQYLSELPEMLAAESYHRRAVRDEELRELQHRHDLAVTRREVEQLQLQTARVQAQQALSAQMQYGNAPHELAAKKHEVEMLDLELAAAERRHLLDEYDDDSDDYDDDYYDGGDDSGGDDYVLDALYRARNQLLSHGLDTSDIDQTIEDHKHNRGW